MFPAAQCRVSLYTRAKLGNCCQSLTSAPNTLSHPCGSLKLCPVFLSLRLSTLFLTSPSELGETTYFPASSWILKVLRSPEVKGSLAGLVWADMSCEEEASGVLSDEPGNTHSFWCRDFSTLHGDPGTSLVDPIFIDNYLAFLPFLHSISHLTAR